MGMKKRYGRNFSSCRTAFILEMKQYAAYCPDKNKYDRMHLGKFVDGNREYQKKKDSGYID